MPLRSWTYIGIVIALGAFSYGAFIVARTLILGIDVPGYASLLSVLLFLGGIQLIGLGVVGEYVGRIYDEAKARPIYLVRRRYQETGQDRLIASGRRVIRIDRGKVSSGR